MGGRSWRTGGKPRGRPRAGLWGPGWGQLRSEGPSRGRAPRPLVGTAQKCEALWTWRRPRGRGGALHRGLHLPLCLPPFREGRLGSGPPPPPGALPPRDEAHRAAPQPRVSRQRWALRPGRAGRSGLCLGAGLRLTRTGRSWQGRMLTARAGSPLPRVGEGPPSRRHLSASPSLAAFGRLGTLSLMLLLQGVRPAGLLGVRRLHPELGCSWGEPRSLWGKSPAWLARRSLPPPFCGPPGRPHPPLPSGGCFAQVQWGPGRLGSFRDAAGFPDVPSGWGSAGTLRVCHLEADTEGGLLGAPPPQGH